MTTRLVHLLRHGPPAQTGLLLGRTDLVAGNDDCPVVRARTEPLTIRQVVASDLMRASSQASNLAAARGLSLSLDPRWRELDFGLWDGQATETIEAGALARFWDDPEANAPPGGERWSQLRARIRAGLADLPSHTLVVTHAGAIRAAVSVLTGLDHRGVWAVDLPYRALLTLRIWPGVQTAGQIVGLYTGDGR